MAETRVGVDMCMAEGEPSYKGFALNIQSL